MSKDTIYREDAIKAFCMDCKGQSEPCEHSGTCKTMKVLRSRKKIPAVEPKQGEWIDKGWHGDWQFETDGRGNCWHEYECSNCNYLARSRTPFCPNCIARMKGADNERP